MLIYLDILREDVPTHEPDWWSVGYIARFSFVVKMPTMFGMINLINDDHLNWPMLFSFFKFVETNQKAHRVWICMALVGSCLAVQQMEHVLSWNGCVKVLTFRHGTKFSHLWLVYLERFMNRFCHLLVCGAESKVFHIFGIHHLRNCCFFNMGLALRRSGYSEIKGWLR